MKWTDIAGDVLRVRQQKTSTAMEIFIHDELEVALSAVFPRSDAAILVGAKRKALNPIYFGAIMAAAIEEAALPTGCVLHGLRKANARIIAETVGKVGSVTGHLSPSMEAEYSRDADQKRLSKAAILGWQKKRRTKQESG